MKAANIGLALLLAPATAGILTLAGCGSTPATPMEQANLNDEGKLKLTELEREVPNLKMTLDNSYAYAIFPAVAKGGIGVEGASGKGTVYEQGNYVGTAHLGMVNVGAVIGGETYTELLVFQTKEAFNNFKSNQLKFDATAAAVALKDGVAADAKFENGLAVFQKTTGGLLLDASIGGQQFTYTSASDLSGSGMKPTTGPTTMPGSPM